MRLVIITLTHVQGSAIIFVMTSSICHKQNHINNNKDCIDGVRFKFKNSKRNVYKFLESKDDLKMRVVRQHRAFTVIVRP